MNRIYASGFLGVVFLVVGFSLLSSQPAQREPTQTQAAEQTQSVIARMGQGTVQYYDEESGMVVSAPMTSPDDREFNVRVPMIRSKPDIELPKSSREITTYYRFGGEGFAYNPNSSTFAGIDKIGVHEKVVRVLGECRDEALYILSKTADREAFLSDASKHLNDGDVWNIKIWDVYQFSNLSRVLLRCDCGQDPVKRLSPFEELEIQTVWELWNLSTGAEPELVERSLRWSHDGKTQAERVASQ